MNITKALISISALAGLFLAAFFLPKAIQNNPKFEALAESMTKDLPHAAPVPEIPQVPATPPLKLVAASAIPARAPVPVAAAMTTASAPAAAPAKKEADLTPFIDAMANADLAKADALLDIIKSDLPASRYEELKVKVTSARAKDAEKQRAAAVVAATPAAAPAPVKSAASIETDKAMIASQTALVETLRQLQATQAETAKVVSELKNRPAPVPASAPAPVEVVKLNNAAATAPAEASDLKIASAATPALGAITIRFGHDSSIIDANEGPKINPVLKALQADPQSKAELRGYADKKGNSTYNLGLSNARALAIKDSLRASGIADARISVVPFGSFGAAADSNAEEMRKVDILVIK